MTVRQALLALAFGCTLYLPTAQGGVSYSPSRPDLYSKRAASTAVTPAASSSANTEELVYSLIVKPHAKRGARLDTALKSADARTLVRATNVEMRVARRMSGGAHVLRLPNGVPLSQARALAARLMQEDSVEVAEPDRIMRPFTVTPNDPAWGSMQWNMMTPAGSNRGGANLPEAWDYTLGSTSVTVAVLDGGYVPHADLNTVLPGYDFLGTTSYIFGVTVGNGDGDGRDADASDPGTAVSAGECGSGNAASRSSWHGTHVAGIVAGLMDNGKGGAGVAPNVRILPVRVLGKCGGPTSDIVDGMRWAAGLYSIPGVGVNPNAARVLNMSLGGSGSCSASFQSAVNDVVNAGKVVVVAAGNDAGVVNQPANCSGAIAVAAHAVDGDLAAYSNSGSQVTISAPGGGCGRLANPCSSMYSANGPGIYSLSNIGNTSPVASPSGDSYALMMGTSMAAPHVSGVIALMLSLDPALTPAQIVTHLRASARAFPAGTSCAQTAYSGKCGAGMLDAEAALSVIAPNISVSNNLVVTPFAYVPLSATLSAPVGRTITSFGWSVLPGNPSAVTLFNAGTLSASFNAPQTGSYGFLFSATDSAGKVASQVVTVRVNTAPVLLGVAPQKVEGWAPLEFQLRAVDQDGDPTVFFGVGLPSGSSLTAGGDFLWPASAPGNYTFSVYANDGASSSQPETVNVVVGGGGGGAGSFDYGWLFGLGLMALALRMHRHWNRVG